jgi:glycosyltransferase involved in cell wall biosynthesis
VARLNIGLYSPYLDSLGGGERYFFTLAEALAGPASRVEILWPDEKIIPLARKRLGLDLEKVEVNREAFSVLTKGLLGRWWFMRQYDRFFWLSDGSLPFLFGERNFLHFQLPFRRERPGFVERLKLDRVDGVIVNSLFTKGVIDESFGVESRVVYPPVDTASFRPREKKKVIASVGRFSRHFMAKKQGVLIEVFKKMYEGGFKDWKLKLIGGVLAGDRNYLASLRKQAAGYPIEFLVEAPFASLVEVLGEARLYWHAAGFGEDARKHPERMEHFGIAPVEAQAAGSIPLVYAGGGLLEVVKEGENGYLWKTEAELLEKTKRLIDGGGDAKMRARARRDCRRFDRRVFAEKMREIFGLA